MIKEILHSPIVVFGCGNPLFGDDGFGPKVIEALQKNYPLPPSVLAADVGTGIGSYLFDLALIEPKPSCIFIVDAVSQPGREPGALFELSIEDMPLPKKTDFSLHQFPSVNLLLELQNLGGVKIRILAVQVKEIPEKVQPGLSPAVEKQIEACCEWLQKQILVEIESIGQETNADVG
ncbi:hydrogenase maturation protease [Desulfoferrobacter suflitae]|uniref:hydrogenase maturation protease n=1 Tax=Desulfoferrobacter suflitae TaxID=2865782 RepID=UPI00216446A1|nr:hydrogenase maturation protease [Desulfoferrobacter suflitae]MCK8601292.1 hydrogenase maturation protease [Desulfoferrobacter suflitae]